MHILSPETDNCSSWIRRREYISWSISMKECCRPGGEVEPATSLSPVGGASNWATEASISHIFVISTCMEAIKPADLSSVANHVRYCAHYFARNWQLLFLNTQKGIYFMINFHERMLPTWRRGRTCNLLITSWRCIKLSHWGQHQSYICDIYMYGSHKTCRFEQCG